MLYCNHTNTSLSSRMGGWMGGWVLVTMEEIPSSPSLLFFGGFSRFWRTLLCLASCKHFWK